MKIFVAFLRGINVGGNTTIQMEELKKSIEEIGGESVKTVLNSGNVIFNIDNEEELTQKIEAKLLNTFGFQISVIVRPMDEIQSLIKRNPFKDVSLNPNTKLQVTFLKSEPTCELKFPYKPKSSNNEILGIFGREVCSKVETSDKRGTPELMKVLEKEFGKDITTRSWGTVQKIAKIES